MPSPCPHCGAPLAAGATVCATCGRALAAAPAASNRGLKIALLIAILLGVGAIVAFVALGAVGIAAAVVVPMVLDARDKVPQQRTLAEMRHVATLLEAYRQTSNGYPLASNASELVSMLTPLGYAGQLQDGWRRPLRYTCLLPIAGACTSYELTSAGSDGKFERDGHYPPTEFPRLSYAHDLVIRDGELISRPEP